MKQRQIVRQGRRVALATCGLLMGVWSLQSCKDDDVLLTGQPSWLGNSIYERLESVGNYTTVLRLIDDLGQHEVLSHTGSKTLFAANDSAYNAWFGHNDWGVQNYDQLSDAQKKLLLNNSMVNNAYLVELLSNVSGNPPMEGMCMRRETAVSIYDSVQILKPEQMPNTAAWLRFKQRGKSIPILKDETASPMIHFLPAYMQNAKITSRDLEILTNHQASDISEAWVNGKKIVERDLTCKNGYLHKVDGVIEASPNMAEILRQHPKMSKWSELIDRFSAPYYNNTATQQYNRLYNTEDSVYTLRYYSKRSLNGLENSRDPNGEAVAALLKFDPGWNHYMYSNTMGYDLHYDAGAMFVPTNEALDYWWNHEGKDLQDVYGSWDSIPAPMLAKLLNVNMQDVFSSSVPSKFNTILDDAKEQLNITEADVDSCFMGCNGVVYMVNKVFAPAEYASVAYPALVNSTTTMNIIYWAIENLNFLPYLLSMDSQYSLLLPTNKALATYLDPASYGAIDRLTGLEAPSALEFYYDSTKVASDRVQAYRFTTTVDENGNVVKGARTQSQVASTVIKDRLTRLMDQLIIVGDVEDGHEYYKSKGGTLVHVTRDAEGNLAFSGGWQTEHANRLIPVKNNEVFAKANGKAYQLNEETPYGAQKSVYLTLQGRDEYSEFFKLLTDSRSGMLSTSINKGAYIAGLQNQGSQNIGLLDNYNYTIYVPTNESIQKLIADGLLPTWDDYEAQTDAVWGTEEQAKQAQNAIKDIIVNFLRYHIQDHSVAVGMAKEDGSYDNSYETMKRNPETGRFFPIRVNHSDNQMTLWDVLAQERPADATLQRHVIKTEGLYNNICREYWLDNSNGDNNRLVFMASDAVLHQIDGPLFYEQMEPWKDKLNNLGR